MESVAKTTASVIETDPCGRFVGPVRSVDGPRLSLLAGRTRWSGMCLPVAVSLSLAFIVTFGSLLISMCKKHNTGELKRHGVFKVGKLQRRRLSVSEQTYLGKRDGEILFHHFHTTTKWLGVISPRNDEYSGVVKAEISVQRPFNSISDASLRRLSETTSESSDPRRSADQGSSSKQVGHLVHELCLEVATTEDLFSTLLDLETVGGDGESPQYSRWLRVGPAGVEAQQESDRLSAYSLTAVAHPPEDFIQRDSSLSDLMDPSTSPLAVLGDTHFLYAPSMLESEHISGPLAQLLNVTPLPRDADESFGATALGGWRPSSTESSRVEYAQLLLLWHSHAACKGSPAIGMKPSYSTNLTVESGESLGAGHTVGNFKASAVLSSKECSNDKAIPWSSAPGVADTTEQSRTSGNSPQAECGAMEARRICAEGLEKQEHELPLLQSGTVPWSLMPLTLGTTGGRPYTKRRVIELRILLSSSRVTSTERLQALLLGKQLLGEIQPFPGLSHRGRRYGNLASQLVHLVIRLDTILWLTSVFPEVTCPGAWWSKLVEFSNMKDLLRIEVRFESKYRIIIRRCIECLAFLVDQKRPPAEEIEWILSYPDSRVSKGRKPLSASSGGTVATANPETGSSDRSPTVEGSQLTTRTHFGIQQESRPGEVFSHIDIMPHGAGIEGGIGQGTLPESLNIQEGENVTSSQQGNIVESATAGAPHKGPVAEHVTHDTQESPQGQSVFSVSSLGNVPQLLGLSSLDKVRLYRHRWKISTEDIAVSQNSRYAIEHPSKAFLILSKHSISFAEATHLLDLGLKIVRGLRPIKHPTKGKDYAKAQAFSLIVIQLDTVHRISSMFPTLTQISEWWPRMVEKCNLKVALQSPVNHATVHCEAIERSKKALESLMEQKRPDKTTLGIVFAYYDNLLRRKRSREEHRVQ